MARRTATLLPLRFRRWQSLRAFEDFGLRRERDWFAAKDDAIWFFGEIFDELLSVGGDDFQVQKSNVQLFQLLLKPFVSCGNELVCCSKHRVCTLGEAIEVCDDVLYMVRIHL